MGDFIETNTQKNAVRDLAVPIADVSTFDALVQSVIDDNPFGCTDYTESGVPAAGVARNREYYTARINYETGEGDTIGTLTLRAPDVAAFGSAAAEVMGDAALALAMGGTAVRDAGRDAFSCQLRCHDPAGEIYFVTFTRNRIRITSYGDDAIRATVEAWADTVPALA
ncbi:MAG: hypothetical protein GKC04_09155 [Methanomicrobiales archaeon]|nr:hypothetical protein [Methanomicrobiales archaeon]